MGEPAARVVDHFLSENPQGLSIFAALGFQIGIIVVLSGAPGELGRAVDDRAGGGIEAIQADAGGLGQSRHAIQFISGLILAGQTPHHYRLDRLYSSGHSFWSRFRVRPTGLALGCVKLMFYIKIQSVIDDEPDRLCSLRSQDMDARIDFSGLEDMHGRVFRAPVGILTARESKEVPPLLKMAEAAAQEGRWVVGFVAYEAAPAFDSALQVHSPMAGLPLACFAVYDSADTVTDEEDTAPTAFSCTSWQSDIDQRHFADDLATIRAAVRAGRLYQSNHSTRLRGDFQGDPAAFYRSLRRAQPDSYGFYLDAGRWQILSVSPELFFDALPGGPIITRPMKGTALRHADPIQDAASAQALCDSAKEQAENLMIVDLLRNDLSRLSRPGGIDVPALFSVEALPSLWQMTSTIRCQPRPRIGLADIFSALFPCGSVTGAPKVTAMQCITERESVPRGPYCGALGVIRPGGHATFSVGIRTVLIRDGQAECGIGSAITWGSSVTGEHAEWRAKERFLWRASADFRLLETLRLEAGRYPLLDRHRQRLVASAARFGFAWTETEFETALATVSQAHPQGIWRVRLMLDRDGRITTEAYALEASPELGLVAWATTPMDSEDEFLRHKTTQRAVYDRHTPLPGGDVFDVLLYNERDEVTEFTRGNLVAEIDGRRLTPALDCGLLPGTLRAELLARGEVTETVIHRADLSRATGLWFINGLRGTVAVRLLDSA